MRALCEVPPALEGRGLVECRESLGESNLHDIRVPSCEASVTVHC